MARLDSDAANGKHVAAALSSRVDPDGFIAEIKNWFLVLRRGCRLGVDMLGIDAKVVLSR